MRRNDVATLAGVSVSEVHEVPVSEVRRALADRVASVILDVATQEIATYWHVGDRYFLDDPYFGEVVDFADLSYNSEIGLHKGRPRGA